MQLAAPDATAGPLHTGLRRHVEAAGQPASKQVSQEVHLVGLINQSGARGQAERAPAAVTHVWYEEKRTRLPVSGGVNGQFHCPPVDLFGPKLELELERL